MIQRDFVDPIVPGSLTPDPHALDPLAAASEKSRLVRRRMRWSAAFLGSAAVLGVGWVMYGGYEYLGFTPFGFAILVLAILFAVLGLVALVGAMVVGFGSPAKRSALVIGLGVVAVTVVLASMLVSPLLSLLGVPLILAVIVVGVSGDSGSAAAHPLPGWRRVGLAFVFTVLTLAVIAAGTLHIVVWNPIAKVPGMNLDEIYAAMEVANESPFAFYIVLWAMFWGIAALLFPVLAGLPALRTFFTTRRIAVVGFLLAGFTAGFMFWAGFNMGMSIADAFMTSGGDAALSGPIIAIVGQLALVAALLIGLPPRRRLPPRAATSATPNSSASPATPATPDPSASPATPDPSASSDLR